MVEVGTRPVRRAVALLARSGESSLHVVRAGRPIEIGLVTGDTGCRVGQAVRARRTEGRVVALRALQRSVSSVQRKTGTGVIKRRTRPGSGVVALRASLREARLHVIRVACVVEVRLVAGVARRAVRQVVSAGRAERRVMTLRALQGDVSAGQCETGGRVIESGTGPAGGVVALRAVLREAGLYVIRIACVIEVRLVAGDASSAGQAVGTGRAESRVVALITLQRDVRAGQCEPSRGVVKSSAGPICGVVALLARSRESGLYVVRTGRAIEVFHVAGGAIGRSAHELSVDMALRARHGHVRTLQREGRELVVIESGRIPRALVVAD